jgi:hypothetical protein
MLLQKTNLPVNVENGTYDDFISQKVIGSS